MKQFNLEEYLKNPSRKVVTRDGCKVRIICTDAKGDFPVVSLITVEDEAREIAYGQTKCGNVYIDGAPNRHDLFFDVEAHEGWINVYRDPECGDQYCGRVYDSEEEAKNRGGIATIKIEWEEYL